MSGYVYILTNQRNGTLYIGVTTDINKRLYYHRQTKRSLSFTRRYRTMLLVYIEYFEDIREAIMREKQLKKWRRIWKIQLIEEANPEWRPLEGP